MSNDFNKPPHNSHNEIRPTDKKKIPVLILIIVGIFLASLIFYMLADREPENGQVPADTSIPATQDTHQNSNTATATDTSVGNTATAAVDDTATAVAKDE